MKRVSIPLWLLALGGGWGMAFGCSAADDSADFQGSFSDAGTSATPDCFSSNECPTGFSCNEFGSCVPPTPGAGDAGVDVPEEVEVELVSPVNSERYLYVGMPEIDALARLDGETLEVSSISVGDQPEIVATIPGSDGAMVLDRNNATLTVVRPEVAGDDIRILPTLPNMNRISPDPSGVYAMAWFDLRAETQSTGGLDSVTSIGSFQDVTLFRLTQDSERSVDLTVGFRPRKVLFDSAGTTAYVVNDNGISVVHMPSFVESGPAIVSPLSLGPADDPTDLEVLVTPDGSLAIVRNTQEPELRVVQLSGPNAGQMSTFALPAQATDLDLSADGLVAYAVLRETSELAVLDLAAGMPQQSDLRLDSFPGETFGSITLSPNQTDAVLYTNASSVERLTFLDLEESPISSQSYSLNKSVRSLGYSPDGLSMLVTHAKDFGNPLEAGLSFEEFVDRSYGYSLVDVATGFTKLELTSADPGEFVFSPTTPRAYVTVGGQSSVGSDWQTHIVELDSGVVRKRALNSPPLDVGVLPSSEMAFVNQSHPFGRVAFFDLASDAMRTLTGFDLNSRIVD